MFKTALFLAVMAASMLSSQGQLIKPVSTDLWDLTQGSIVTASNADSASNHFGMFGEGGQSNTSESQSTLFPGGQTNGYHHFVEWKTASAVTVGQIRVFGAGDGAVYLNEREFAQVIIKAKSAGSLSYDLTLVDFSPTHPYNYAGENQFLVVDTNIAPVTAQEFRAEFVQWDAGRGFDGPRIIELDALPPSAPAIQPVSTDLWDVAQGSIVTASNVGSASNQFGMFGANGHGNTSESQYTYFPDGETNGYRHFVEWKTASAVTVGQIRLFGTGDGAVYLNEREFAQVVIKAKSAGSLSYDLTLLDFSPTHPYDYAGGNPYLVVDTNISPVTAQEFRAEFVQWNAGRGFDGPRIIELDAFPPAAPAILPVSTDLWDVAQGSIVTASDAHSLSNRFGMFGVNGHDNTSESQYTYFPDGQTNGSRHFVEWKTASAVTVGHIRLFGAGDGAVYLNEREFAQVIIKAKSLGSSSFDLTLVDFQPVHPYDYVGGSPYLVIDTNIVPVTAQEFRAEFVQWDAGRGFDGPRIIELDAFSPPDSLVAHYKMDGDALDSSSNHLDGTLTGPVPTADRYGNTNKALLFAGGSDRINCGNPAAFNFAGDFTISVWAKQTGSQPTRYLVSKYDFEHSGTPHAFGLGTAESAEPYGFILGDGPGYEDLRGATPLNDNAWHALALVFKNGSSISLYRDGVLNATRTVGSYPPFTNGLPLTIGGTPTGPGFGGAIDDVKIFNRALSPSEITGMFELDRPADPVVLPVENDARIPLYVGTIGSGIQGAVDGPISVAQFDHPSTSVLDKAGNIYIIEANLTGFYTPGVGGHAIRRIDTNGVVSTWAGGQEAGMVNGPKEQAKFSGMGGMVFDHLGNAFVADRLNNLIRKIGVDGIVSTFAGSTYGFADGSASTAQFRSPIGLCIDTNDNLYVADWENARIRQITPAGEVSTFAGGAAGHKDGFRTSAQFNGPNYLFITADGTIYVSDWLNGMVRRIGTDGMVATIATGLAYIESITVDAQGFLYASVPPGVHKLIKMDSEGHVIWQMGNEIGYEDGPAATAKVSHYTPPLFYSNGDFLMTDGVQRIRKVTVAVPGAVTMPFIYKQPESTNTLVGGTASFSVLAAGGQLSFQWFKGTNVVVGANQPSLTLSNLLGSDSGSYFVSVSNAVGHVDSQLAELSVNNLNGLPVGSRESHTDLFEYPQNIQILAASPAYSGFSASRMFSTAVGTDRGENLLFASGKSPGFTHFVEWKTKKAVTLTNIILHASGALTGQPVMQEFNSFVLKAKRATNDEYHVIASIQPSHPYGVSALNYFTLLDSSFDPEVLQYFRAEFTQRDPANYPFGGPRVMELDGFGSEAQDSIAPIVTVTSPVEGSFTNERVTLSGTITDNIGVTSSLYEVVGMTAGSLSLDSSGKFSVPNLALKPGTNVFKITARDGASNETVVVVKVDWTPLRSLAFSNIVSVQEGGQFSLPLALTSDGTVGALDAVIHYDTNLLGDVDFVWADALTTAFKQVSTSTTGEVRIVFALAGTALPSGASTLGSFVARAHSLAAETTSTLGLTLGGVYDQSGSAIGSGNTAIDGSVIIKTRKIIGDNNANDRLDVGDATTILTFVAAPENVKPWDITGNDLNINAALDPGDAIKVLRTVVGLDAQPVIPVSMGSQTATPPLGVVPPSVGPTLPSSVGSGRVSAASVVFTNNTGTGYDVVTYVEELPSLGLSSGSNTLVAGQKLVVKVNLAALQGVNYAGSSFRLTYPASLLRLANASAQQVGTQVPLGSAVLWNLSPAVNDYAKQDGQVAFAAASATAWPTSVNGSVAEFSFDITEAVSNVYAVQVVLDRSEITQANGIIAVSSAKTLTLHSQAAQQAQVSVASISEDGKTFSLKINGQIGGKYRVDVSTDLSIWTAVQTIDSQGGVVTFEDASADHGQVRFYRAVLVN